MILQWMLMHQLNANATQQCVSGHQKRQPGVSHKSLISNQRIKEKGWEIYVGKKGVVVLTPLAL